MNLEWMLWNSLQVNIYNEIWKIHENPAYVQISLDHFGMGQSWEKSDVLG